MRSFGWFLLIYGAISAALKLLQLGVVLLILVWVDFWGPEIGWAIRIAMMVVGGVLVGLSYRKPAD